MWYGFAKYNIHHRAYAGFNAFVHWFSWGLLLMKMLKWECQCCRPTNTHFHLSVCSANTVGVCTAGPFFMSPEWFSPEKQSALSEQSEALSTQWQRMGHLSVASKPPRIQTFLRVSSYLCKTWSFLKGILQPLNPDGHSTCLETLKISGTRWTLEM